MPSAKKDGKKKKKSKKELEQERLLLEEQKRKEEEAQRLAELARQREKELIEQKENEERDQFLERQSEAHEQERLHLKELVRVAAEEVYRRNTELASKEEWEHYLSCSPLPLPTKEPEVTAFLTVYQTIQEKQSFEHLRQAILHIEPLVKNLQIEYGKAMDCSAYSLANRYADNLLSLHSIVQRKMDAMTAYVLQNSDQFPREPSENLLLIQELHTQCDYCLWVNYAKNPRHKSFDVHDVHVALPKTLTLSNVAIRVIFDHSDLTLMAYHLKDPTHGHTVLYGVLFLDLLDVPDLPKTIDFWTLRPLLSQHLQIRTVAYPFSKSHTEEMSAQTTTTTTTTTSSSSSSSESVPESESLNLSSPSSNSGRDPPSESVTRDTLGGGGPSTTFSTDPHDEEAIQVSFTLGSGLFIHPLATIKWWNNKTCQWEQQGISEVEIDRGKGTVQFKTTVFKPCALVQAAYSDFPLEDWKLKPFVPENSNEFVARYTLNGKWTDAEFEISKEGVKLIRPLSDSLMADFKDQYFPPTHFFLKLLRYGLSFLSPHALNETPEEKECYTSIPFKLSHLTFQLSKNHDRNEANSCILLVSKDESTPYTVVVDFHRVIVTIERRVIYIANEEDLTRFHSDFKPHGTLLSLLDELTPFVAPDWQFISNLTHVLRLTCPLS